MKKNISKPTISRQFLTELKLHDLPAYKIAQRAGVNHVTLSKLICGIIPTKERDERIVAVGKILGVTASECFQV